MQEVNLKEIGKRIQYRRKQQGYTQEQLADMMDVSVQMVSNLERGNKAIRIDNLVKLSKILDVSTDYILTGNETSRDIVAFKDEISKLSNRDRKTIEMLITYLRSEET